MARYSIAGTTGTSENTIVFIPSGGHSHNGQNSSLIDTSAYSVYDFSPTFVGTDINPERAVRQENNRIALEDLIKRVVNNSVLAPAGIRLDPGSLNGSLIAANTITALQLAANTVTADELTANLVLVNNIIQSNSFTSGSTGWQISYNGDSEFNNTTVRGTIQANTGRIGGANGWIITSNTLSSTNSLTYLYANGTAVFGNTTIYSNGRITNGNFTVSANGVLSATSANISGTITAGSGSTIGGWNIYTSTLESSSGGTILYGSGAFRIGTPNAYGSDYATISNSADFTVYGHNGVPSAASAGVTRMYGAFMNIKKGNSAEDSQPNLQLTHKDLFFFDSAVDTCGIVGGNDGGSPSMYVLGASSYISSGGYISAGSYLVAPQLRATYWASADGVNRAAQYYNDMFSYAGSSAGVGGGAAAMVLHNQGGGLTDTFHSWTAGIYASWLTSPNNPYMSIGVIRDGWQGFINMYWSGNSYSSRTITGASDRRVKDNIEPLSSVVDVMSLIDNIEPKIYDYLHYQTKTILDDGTISDELTTAPKKFGFIAQELIENLGEYKDLVVDEVNDPRYDFTLYTTEDRGIIAILWEAVRQLKKKVDTLELENGV